MFKTMSTSATVASTSSSCALYSRSHSVLTSYSRNNDTYSQIDTCEQRRPFRNPVPVDITSIKLKKKLSKYISIFYISIPKIN